MANYMFKGIQKIKNFIGYSNEVEEQKQKEVVSESKKDAVIDTKTTKEIRVCDCCNEQDIEITQTSMFRVDEKGESTPLFQHPRETVENGVIYEGVAVCKSCYSVCENELHQQFVWITGKMNCLHKEIISKNETIEANNKLIEQIKLEAEEKIRAVAEESNLLNSEINNLQNTVELYKQEQCQLEEQF